MNKLKNKFVIVTAFHNAENYIYENLIHSLAQDFEDLGILFVDDASTDNTKNILFSEVGNMTEFESNTAWSGKYRNKNVFYYKNQTRNFSPGLSQKVAIEKYIENTGTICGIVDGDDFLSYQRAVSYVKEVMDQGYLMYASSPILLDENDKRKGYQLSSPFRDPYEEGSIEMREQGWRFHHFRAFSKVLSDNVDTGRSFYDPGGNLLTYASDTAFFRPMFEMAGYEKIKVETQKYFYKYRSEISTNDHISNPNLQNRNALFTCNAFSGVYFIDGQDEAENFISGFRLHPNYVNDSGVNFSGMENNKSGYFVWHESCWHPDGKTGCSTPYNLLTGIL